MIPRDLLPWDAAYRTKKTASSTSRSSYFLAAPPFRGSRAGISGAIIAQTRSDRLDG
jgi:hypothetical protein